jgi:hypothetical protein
VQKLDGLLDLANAENCNALGVDVQDVAKVVDFDLYLKGACDVEHLPAWFE